MSRFIVGFVAIFVGMSVASAREGRGMHETKVVCSNVRSLSDAQACFSDVGAKMPTENDDNAVLVTDSEQAKALLIDILTYEENTAAIADVEQADYISAVVQNDDEAHIYYYLLQNGKRVKPNLVSVIADADLMYAVCPEEEGGRSQMDGKFAKVKNLLLGMDSSEIVAGKVWLDDKECDF